ncbi:HSP20 family protein [Desulfocicer vacuolatum DSM 3385]|uniref:HSP20 family protein n=1 Tax=Desulfocicer vacuolatum DSM 3385 TaxID=1121400 RepID=A0A1W2EMQ1_9BACT|nr:Hsp20/alpha crystallin family protein [Desulfocicer vacuolatum]SMD10980.1 HSP20 family protein [Desulfocicer vacuolatum DSM 3385]
MFTRWSDIDRMFGVMDLMRGNFDRLSNEFYRSRGNTSSWVLSDGIPRTNLYDKGDSFAICAEVPGFAKEDLNIRLQGNYLEISGKRKSDLPEGYSIHRSERGTFDFSRSMTLPTEVDSSKVEAALKDGILTLTLPKAEAAKPKLISVN